MPCAATVLLGCAASDLARGLPAQALKRGARSLLVVPVLVSLGSFGRRLGLVDEEALVSVYSSAHQRAVCVWIGVRFSNSDRAGKKQVNK